MLKSTCLRNSAGDDFVITRKSYATPLHIIVNIKLTCTVLEKILITEYTCKHRCTKPLLVTDGRSKTLPLHVFYILVFLQNM